MKKYLRVIGNTWNESFTYRLNFIMWRVRIVIHLLTLYFLWYAVLPNDGSSFSGYSQQAMLTYILVLAVVSAIVSPTRSWGIGDDIISGNLSNFLLRPINFFYYWLAKDAGDRITDIFFSILEIALLIFILRPVLFLQTDVSYLFLLLLSMMLSAIMYFFFNVLLGFIGFWNQDVWAPRFIFYTVVSFFAGGYFPLDILPEPFFSFFHILPFGFLLYFPVKIYLGQLPIIEIIQGLLIAATWVLFFFLVVHALWKRGLRLYTAQGG